MPTEITCVIPDASDPDNRLDCVGGPNWTKRLSHNPTCVAGERRTERGQDAGRPNSGHYSAFRGRRPAKCVRRRQVRAEGYERASKGELTVIAEIESGARYVVKVDGIPIPAKVVVANHGRRKYLETMADDVRPDNLLSLPRCSLGRR